MMASLASLRDAGIILCVAVLLAILADRSAPRFCSRMTPNFSVLVRRMAVIAVIVTGALCAMWFSGLTLIPAVAVGAIFASVSLGAQGILGNVFASFYLLAERPFEIGDEITIGMTTGTVVDIGLRVTKLKLATGHASVPNSVVINSTVIENGSRRCHDLDR